ncbi:MAG TPA: reverse transcriptase domain-containing protein, partial [Alphaproteobacteria bacterium]|nr:reverse transcriptase domain-containing protein [Alphaproteobacteria bacterium]
KIVQRMMQKVLESVYDPLFLKCSYGFRAGIGCHDAIKDLHSHLFRQEEVSTIIDIDLANFFGTIDHKEVINILREKIEDERFLRYIVRMFKGGVLANGELTMSEEGVVQGSSCSPIISNIFAHYVIDVWFEKMVKSHCNGKVELFRYADDAIMCCQFESDAIRIKSALSKRLSKFKLKLNEEKTTVTSFSRRKYEEGKKQGVFHFLGFTFFWGRSRKGKALPKVETRGKSLRSKLKSVNEWARQIRNKYRLNHIWKIFGSKIRGHIQYFGVSFNTRRVEYFVNKAVKILFKWLNRRSQRKSFNWEKFSLFVEKNPLPKIKVHHPFF